MKVFWRWAKPLGLGALCVLLALYFSPLSAQVNYAIATHDVPYFWIRLFNNGAFILALPGLAIGVIAPCFVLGSLIQARLRHEKLKSIVNYAALIWLVNWASFSLSSKIQRSWPQRRAGLQNAATRAQTLTSAIERYKADQGQPPADLEEWVPRYLPQIPATGMAAYPKFRYAIRAKRPGGANFGVYELSVFTPFGLSIDRF